MTTTTNTEPAAWIGCLSCYNNGTLRGKWITAQQAADELTGDDEPSYGGQAETVTIDEYTAPRCRKCGGDEFDVFDTEHLPTKMGVREFYENAAHLAYIEADELERLTVLGQWQRMTLAELIAYDDTNYCGQWDTFQEYAENFAQDTGDLAALPEHLAYYFDYEKYARDLAHDYYYDDTTGHTWFSV